LFCLEEENNSQENYSCSDESIQIYSTDYMRGNIRYPIYEIKKSGYSYKEIYKIITRDENKLCDGIASLVDNTAVFLLNFKEKTIFANMLCDSMGVWRANGIPKDYIVLNGETVSIPKTLNILISASFENILYIVWIAI